MSDVLVAAPARAERPLLVRLLMPSVVWLAAAGLTLWLAPQLTRSSFVFFTIAVMFAAWYGGVGISLLASIASVLAVHYYLVEPQRAFFPVGLSDFIPLAVLSSVSAITATLGRAQRRSVVHAAELTALAGKLDDQAVELSSQSLTARELAATLMQVNARLDEAALSANETRARFQAVLDSLPDATVMYDGEWRCTYLNPVARDRARTLGIDPNAAIGRPVIQGYESSALDVFLDNARVAIEEQRVVEHEDRSLADGRWFETRIVPMPDGAVVYSRDVTERKRAELAEHLLAKAGALLGSSLEYAGTIQRLAELVVPAIADWCGVEVLNDETGELEQLAVAHVDPARVEWARSLRRRYPPNVNDTSGTPEVVRSGRSEFYPDVTDEMLVTVARDPDHLAILRELGMRAIIIAPIVTQGKAIGALSLVAAETGRRFEAADVALAEELGRRAGLAIENARLFRGELRARDAAESAVRRTARLQEITAALSATLTPAEVARVVVENGLFALGARAGAVAAIDEEKRELHLLSAVGYPIDQIARFTHIPIDTPFPLADAARSGQPIILATSAEREEMYPHLAALIQSNGGGIMASIPLFVEGRSVGAMGMNFPASVELDREGRQFLDALAQQCAQALERTRLYEAEREAREAAERLQVLAAALASALTPEDVANVVLSTGALAIGAEVGMVGVLRDDGASFELIGSIGVPRRQVEKWRRFPADPGTPLGDAIATGRAIFVASSEEYLDRWPQLAPDVEAMGIGAAAILPLGVHERVVGALSLDFRAPRAFSRRERALLETIAALCAQALDRARLYDVERQTRQEADAANRAKSDFLGTMSHELRTPLNAITGYVELLSLGLRGPVNEAQQHDLERVRRSSQVLMALVNDILNFARVEAGQVDFHIDSVPVAPVLSDLEALVGPQMREKGLLYSQYECGEQLSVRADPERLKQILMNLLTNAMKFTEEGGGIRLTCELDGAAVHICVGDTGRGMAADQLARIFEPFVQIDRHLTKASQQGVGLGLAISRDLARRMNGDLHAESSPGAGSTFTLVLPHAEPVHSTGVPATSI